MDRGLRVHSSRGTIGRALVIVLPLPVFQKPPPAFTAFVADVDLSSRLSCSPVGCHLEGYWFMATGTPTGSVYSHWDIRPCIPRSIPCTIILHPYDLPSFRRRARFVYRPQPL